ncbi:MAG: YqhA family protein [Candidatus Nanopelagicales bacterium]
MLGRMPQDSGARDFSLGGAVYSLRWLFVPFLLGLFVAILALAWNFIVEGVLPLITDFNELSNGSGGMDQWTLKILGLIDSVLVVNLMVMILIGTFHTYVREVRTDGDYLPEWLGHANAHSLKTKVLLTVSGIGMIQLLAAFIDLEDNDGAPETTWLVIFQGLLLAAAVAFAVVDRLQHSNHAADDATPTGRTLHQRNEHPASSALATAVYKTRWVQLPMYAGLLIALIAYLCAFAWIDLAPYFEQILDLGGAHEDAMMLASLQVISDVLTAGLVVVLLIGGYQSFIGPIHDRDGVAPSKWLRETNAGNLKVTVASTILLIATVQFLFEMVRSGEFEVGPEVSDLAWLQGALTVSVAVIAFIEWLGRSSHAAPAVAPSRQD